VFGVGESHKPQDQHNNQCRGTRAGRNKLTEANASDFNHYQEGANMIPRYCTSMFCCDYGCDYCSECSHAYHIGAGSDINGKSWRWQYNPWEGPTFLRKDGNAMLRQPSIKSPAWDVFQKWFVAYDMEQYKHMWC
jgi:hypothetical protein